MCKMATIETEQTIEQLILTEGIDFAVPPGANEQQILHAIQNALDLSLIHISEPTRPY